MLSPMPGPTRRHRLRAVLPWIVLSAGSAGAFIASPTVHAASSAAFFDVRVTVIRSCRIDTDAIDVDGARLRASPPSLRMMCDAAATAQIKIGPTAVNDDPIASSAAGMIASARPAVLPALRVPPTTLQMTIDF